MPERRTFLTGFMAAFAGLIGAKADALTAPFKAARAFPGLQYVGGYYVGQSVTDANNFYNGYTLSWADDFTGPLDIVGPSNPHGRYFSRLVGNSTNSLPNRGGVSASGTVGVTQVVDPLWTGWLDANRGVPIGSQVVRQQGSILTTQARAATAAECALLVAPTVNLNLETEVDCAGAVAHCPASGALTIIDYYFQASPGLVSQATGSETSLWDFSVTPVTNLGTKDEQDFIENPSATTTLQFNTRTWTGGAGSTTSTTNYSNTPPAPEDGNWHLLSIVFDPGAPTCKTYLDGSLLKTAAINPNIAALPLRPLIENFTGTTGFTQATWTALGTGLTAGVLLNIDYMRVWRQTGLPHYKPLEPLADINLAYGAGSTSFTLPSALALWGDAGVTEYMQTVAPDANCPGCSSTTATLQGPSGLSAANGCTVTFNTGTRALVVNQTTGNAGRLHVLLHAYKTSGCTCEPARFVINIGPNVDALPITSSSGIPGQYDAYFWADVGTITPKTFALSGQPAGVSINAQTGIITWDNTIVGSTSYTLIVTNNVGQSANATVTHTVVTTAANYLASAGTVDSVDLTYTFPSMPLGPAYSGRDILVMVGSRNTAGTLSCTIGGVSATAIANYNAAGTTGQISLFGLNVPSGTSADIVITSSSAAVSRLYIGVYSAPLTSLTASDTQHSTTITTQAVSVTSNVPANGIVLSMAFWNKAMLASLWSGTSSDIPPFQSQGSRALNSADLAATATFGSKSIPAGNAALAVKDTYTQGWITGSPSLAILVAVTLA